jgi:death on curing protein
MGQDGFTLAYPTIEDIARLNHKTIYLTGGNADGAGRFINENSLSWVLEAIQYPLFDVDRFPTISEKAAALAWTIISRHVFIDGNKRTGMIALDTFLRMNGFYLMVSDDDILTTAQKIATSSQSNYTLEQFSEWVRERMEYLPLG